MFPFLLFFFIQLNLNPELPRIVEEPTYTVYIFLSEDCPICRYYIPEINRLYEDYESDSIQFVGVFPNFSSKEEKIKRFVEDYKLSVPTKTDYFKTLANSLEARLTPEVFVVDQEHTILYKGRIDNAYADIGQRRRVVTKHELEDFLSNLRSYTIEPLETEAIGCFIHYSDFN